MVTYDDTGSSLLSIGNYITVNRGLIKALGLNEAVLLGELSAEYRLAKDRETVDNGWFKSTVNYVREHTGLGEKPQRAALEKLGSYGIVEVERRGMPQARYVRLNFPLITEASNGVAPEPVPAPEPQMELDLEPEVDPNADADAVIRHFNEVMGANSRFIKSNRDRIRRLLGNYSVQDLIDVIDYKHGEWINNPKMRRYLTMNTLFRESNFDGYLTQAHSDDRSNGGLADDFAQFV